MTEQLSSYLYIECCGLQETTHSHKHAHMHTFTLTENKQKFKKVLSTVAHWSKRILSLRTVWKIHEACFAFFVLWDRALLGSLSLQQLNQMAAPQSLPGVHLNKIFKGLGVKPSGGAFAYSVEHAWVQP